MLLSPSSWEEAAQTPVIHDGACLAPISQLLMGLREGAGHLNMLRPSHYVAQRSLVMAESGMTTGKEISNRLWLRPLRKLPAFCHPFLNKDYWMLCELTNKG